MAASPQEMQQIMAQGQPPQAGPAGDMTAPPPQDGSKMMASIGVQGAMKLLQNALPHFGAGSREGRALLDVLKKLALEFGEPMEANHLVPSEIQSLVRSVQQGQQAPMPAPQEQGNG